jgi:GMP synthase PP-ATPase subunit
MFNCLRDWWKRKTLRWQLYKILRPFCLRAEITPIQSVGVVGDERSYLPVVIITGPFPGWDTLEVISTHITNELPVSRVAYEIERKACEYL